MEMVAFPLSFVCLRECQLTDLLLSEFSLKSAKTNGPSAFEGVKSSPNVFQHLANHLSPFFHPLIVFRKRFGQVRLGQVWLGQVRLGQGWLGWVRLGQELFFSKTRPSSRRTKSVLNCRRRSSRTQHLHPIFLLPNLGLIR